MPSPEPADLPNPSLGIFPDPASFALVDVGKSGARLTLADGDSSHTIDDALPLSPAGIGDQGAQIGDRTVALLRRLEAHRSPSPSVVALGSTAELSQEERQSLALTIHNVFPAATIVSGDDGTFAHARFIGAQGVLLSVGTGVIGIGLDAAGTLRRYDGWGPLIGDRGSAADLGREGLRTAYRHHDARIDSALHDLAVAEFGSPSAFLARSLTSDAEWPVRFAAFGGKVALLAERDASTAELVDRCAQQLAETAKVAASDAAVAEIVITGRFGTLPAMQSAIQAAFSSRGLALRAPVDAQRSADVIRRLLEEPYSGNMHITTARRPN